MMDLNQTQNCVSNAALNITSPLLIGNINPSLDAALANGLFDLSSNHPSAHQLSSPHLPPLDIDANSQMNTSPIMPPMPIVDVIGNNIPPPSDALDWNAICNLKSSMGQPQQPHSQTNTNSNRKRKQINYSNSNQLMLNADSTTKRRKLNN